MARNEELVGVGKESMTAFQERKKTITAFKEEQVELMCRLCAVSDVVSDKKKYYENLLAKWNVGADKTI